MASSVFTPRFLVLSLGNAGARYANTFHNAGHIALTAASSLLPGDQPPWTHDHHIGKKTVLASRTRRYALAQSPTLMNVSGKWVADAYKHQLGNHGFSPSDLSLVIVHDDLELELGVVKIRPFGRSARGHNGIKSCQAHLQESKDTQARWHRICVGIGRPTSREGSVISDYVLRPISDFQLTTLQKTGARGVADALRTLEADWKKEFEQGNSGPSAKETMRLLHVRRNRELEKAQRLLKEREGHVEYASLLLKVLQLEQLKQQWENEFKKPKWGPHVLAELDKVNGQRKELLASFMEDMKDPEMKETKEQLHTRQTQEELEKI